MKKRLATLSIAFLAFWPFSSSADQDVQARFEKSLNDAKSISHVEIEWLDTMTLQHPPAIISTNGKVFSRTFQYSYIASGQKYRAVCKLISATQTNLIKFSESAFDGDSYATYSSGSQQMTKGSGPPMGGEGESPNNPLIAPFMFLSSQSDDGRMHVLRFTDIISDEFTNGHSLPTGSRTNGLLEIVVSGPPLGGQPTQWVIGISEAGDSFTPTIIKHIAPGQEMEQVSLFQNYTNLGTYHFPTKIEWTMSSYPPTSPPNVIASGTASLISARTPDQIEDSVFKLDSEQKEAVSVWDWDQTNFIKSTHENSNSNGIGQALPKIYDESVDGSKQIADVLDMAKEEHKRVLLMFGANWCGWCHKLHTLFETDQNISDVLKANFVIVMVDVNKNHNSAVDASYSNPTQHGLPVIVILDADGKQLTTEDTGLLEEGDHHSPQKVLAFLKEWLPK